MAESLGILSFLVGAALLYLAITNWSEPGIPGMIDTLAQRLKHA